MIADDVITWLEPGGEGERYRLAPQHEARLRARLSTTPELHAELGALVRLAFVLDTQLGSPRVSRLVLAVVEALVPRLQQARGAREDRARAFARDALAGRGAVGVSRPRTLPVPRLMRP